MRLMQMLPMSRSFAREMNRLQRELEQAFGTVARPSGPAINMWEDENNFHIETELPGYDPSKIEAHVMGNDTLVIKGQREPVTHEKAVSHRQERSFGSFERTITLPKPVSADQVQAKYTNGVLHLTLAKAPEAKPQKIAITVG
jgi:HSP20 family protein